MLKKFRSHTVAMAILAGVLASCSSEQSSDSSTTPPGMGAQEPVEVAVLTLHPQSVPRSTELPGRVVALATAEIRPQVDGIVRKVSFREGGAVEAGDVLYELEPAKFDAALAAAEASYKKAQASVVGAQSTLERNERLVQTSAVSEQVLDDAKTALLEAQAAAEGAKADADTARINLSDTKITAPISGIVGLSSVSVGSLVTANQTTALATVRQIDPIHVDLVDTSSNLLKIGDLIRSGQLDRPGRDEAPTAVLTLESGNVYEQTGSVSTADRTISESTGTFSLRATFDNPRQMLLPGMFVRAKIMLGNTPNAYLVPQRAVTRNASGEATAYFVTSDSKIEQRVITTIDSLGNDWVVTEDIVDGDRLVVDGFQKISVGAVVTTVDAKIDDDGVVEQKLGADSSEAKADAPEASE